MTLISGKTYEELIFETICNPLGMNDIYIAFNDKRKKMLVQGRDESGNPIPPSSVINNAFVGAGGIKSSAKDLANLLRQIYMTQHISILHREPQELRMNILQEVLPGKHIVK